MTEPRISVAVRFPDELHDELKAAAEGYGVSMNWLVNKAVVDFLNRILPADEIRLTRDE